ncbi:MAG TPA: PilC/PilY family type IV pilus protein, partial [Gammaproteobacteria bacterium]|nr:PilC/PilY family type IV pilus protein [Gammaproteobacteria bacterium]
FAATSAQAVADDLDVILSQIQFLNQSTTSAAVNSTGLRTDSVAYQAKYDPLDSEGDFTGNLVAYPIDVDTGEVELTNPDWQAQKQVDNLNWDTERLIATYNPASNDGVTFRWDKLATAQQDELKASDESDYTTAKKRLDYLRGDTTNEGLFRERSHILGDIVHSDPTYVGPPSAFFTGTYVTFQTTYADRTPMIYTGGNDGMLHAFNANTGEEEFAFIPNGVFNNLIDLTDPSTNLGKGEDISQSNHKFYVDGSPAAADVQFSDGTWHTVLAGGLNNGGESIYALDISNPDAMTTEQAVADSVLWEFTDSTLGRTYSRPAIVTIGTGYSTSGQTKGEVTSTESVVIFGSGYNNSDGKPYLYVVDAETGSLVKKMDLCSIPSTNPCDSTKPNGLSSVAAVSSSGSSVIDIVYAGDLQGHLWKISMPPRDADGFPQGGAEMWTARVLFTAKNSNGDLQPITTKPAVSFHPLYPDPDFLGLVVYFGTGKFLGSPDINDGTGQSFYAIWDDPATSDTVPRTSLAQRTLTQQTVTADDGTITTVRTVSGDNIDWTPDRGWYMDLPEVGERSVTTPRLDAGRIIFTTFVPAASSGGCDAGGHSWLMAVNYATGNAFTEPELDINGDLKIDSDDKVTVGDEQKTPIGMSLGKSYASAPTIMRTRKGKIHDIKLITQSTGKIKTVAEHGDPGSASSWRQIQQ